MKRVLLFLIFSVVAVLCFPQKIELKIDLEKKDFETKSEKECFKAEESYTVKITGINSAVIGYRIKSKAFALSSPIPEVLKPVFPGLTEEIVLGFTGTPKRINDYNLEIQKNPDL